MTVLLPLLLKYWKLALAIVVVVAAFLAGIRVESNAREAQLATQERALNEAFRRQAAKSRQIAQDLTLELNDAQAQRELDGVAYREAVRASRTAGKPLAECRPATAPRTAHAPPLATTEPRMPIPTPPPPPEYLPLPDEPPGEPRFTAEFVRLFDLALDIGRVPSARDPGPADAAAARTGSVSPEDVLDVHGENAAACAQDRANLKGWQELARRHGWAK